MENLLQAAGHLLLQILPTGGASAKLWVESRLHTSRNPRSNAGAAFSHTHCWKIKRVDERRAPFAGIKMLPNKGAASSKENLGAFLYHFPFASALPILA